MVNKAMIIGHVGQDPEVRYTGSADNGTKVATLRVATTEKYRNKDGNTQESTEWHSVVCWRQLADIVEKYVKKGTQLYIEGKLKTRSWEDNAGAKHYVTDIVATTMQLLGKKEQTAGDQARPITQSQPTAPAPIVSDNPEDDLPF